MDESMIGTVKRKFSEAGALRQLSSPVAQDVGA
jgi:hypothetical protein